MDEKAPRKLIVEALMKHPEGLTLVSLAKITGLHRHTSTKYLYEMTGAGIVYQRKVGPARLCYLKEGINCRDKERKVLENLEKKWVGRKSQVKFIAILLLGLVLASGAVIAANFMNETSNVSLIGESILNLSTANTTFEIPLENVTNISLPNENAENISNVTLTNTSEIVNETQNVSEVVPINLEPSINVSIQTLEKITRGENLTIKARIENDGTSSVKNVVLDWVLPNGFEITSEENDCEILEPASFCYSTVVVNTSLSAELGKNDIKILVNYES